MFVEIWCGLVNFMWDVIVVELKNILFCRIVFDFGVCFVNFNRS